MANFPKRRWLRFSIRTLLVAVTVFCVWLGWQVSIVRERDAVRELVETKEGSILNVETFNELECLFGGAPTRRPIHLSWIRRMMGDEDLVSISAPALSTEELTRIRVAFPEAEQVFVQPSLPLEPDPNAYRSTVSPVPEEIDRGMMVPHPGGLRRIR